MTLGNHSGTIWVKKGDTEMMRMMLRKLVPVKWKLMYRDTGLMVLIERHLRDAQRRKMVALAVAELPAAYTD